MLHETVNVLALYDIHGNIDALEAVLADPRAARPDAIVIGGERMRERWPDVRSIGAALIDPVAPGEVTRIFESLTG